MSEEPERIPTGQSYDQMSEPQRKACGSLFHVGNGPTSVL